MALARQRFAAHSAATLAAIDDRIAGIALDRSSTVEAIAKALDVGRVEIVGDSGSGKSALLKALAEEERLGVLVPSSCRPRVRLKAAGCRSLHSLVLRDRRLEFLVELAASGCTATCFDGLDRVSDESVRATIIDLIIAAAKVPMMRVVATVGRDFSVDQRHWLPETAIVLLAAPRFQLVRSMMTRLPNLRRPTATGSASEQPRGPAADAQSVSAAAVDQPVGWTLAAHRSGVGEKLVGGWDRPCPNRASRSPEGDSRALARQAVAQVTQLDISDIGSAVTEVSFRRTSWRRYRRFASVVPPRRAARLVRRQSPLRRARCC